MNPSNNDYWLEGGRKNVEGGGKKVEAGRNDLHAVLTSVFVHNSTLISATELSLRQERGTTSSFIFTNSHSNPSLLDGGYEGL